MDSWYSEVRAFIDRRFRPASPVRLVSAGTAGIVLPSPSVVSAIPAFLAVQTVSSGPVPRMISQVTLNSRVSSA